MTAKHLPKIVAPLDALLLKGDADPTTRAIMSAAMILDEAPDYRRLTEAFERATHAVPRMRATVVRPTLSLGMAHWVPDDDFDVLDHVRQVGAPGDRSLRAVLEMASASAATPFDPARALWDAVLVTGLDDGSGVVLIRVHHAIADGVRILEMMANLVDLEPNPSKPDLPALEQRGSSLTRRSERVVHTTSQTALAHQRQALIASRVVLRSALRPIASVTHAASYARSAVRTFSSGGASPSPLLRSRSRGRRFGILEFPLDAMRECARAHSATVNDVFLAGLVGGMSRYHEASGTPVECIPVSFPIDISGEAGPDSGNHFSAAVIAGPAFGTDAAARIDLIHQLVASRRSEPGLDAPLRLAPVLHQAPSWLATAGMHAYSRRVDIQASNIVGPDCGVYLAGARVDRFYAFGPLPGVPVMAVLVSYEGTCTIGFTIDPAAVDDVELFMRVTTEAFDELLAHGTT